MTQELVAEGLFTWPSDEPRLIASKCCDCATVTFPRQASCPNCADARSYSPPISAQPRAASWTAAQSPYSGHALQGQMPAPTVYDRSMFTLNQGIGPIVNTSTFNPSTGFLPGYGQVGSPYMNIAPGGFGF